VTAAEQLALIASALRLEGDATYDQVIAQATGLVAAVDDLRTKVYVGIIDGALADHNVTV
jgi:hypothetical protein